ncbi:hypothetical protein K1719_012129 [Acacia pycnantha]|nr:hypothetical protein K1719_012129 [Acacia pycnantha]
MTHQQELADMMAETRGSIMKNGEKKRRGRPVGSGKPKAKVGSSGKAVQGAANADLGRQLSSFVEEAQGFSGGIWVLWKSQDVQVDVSLEETEKEGVRRHASQLPTAPTSTNSKCYILGCFTSRRLEFWSIYIGPIDNLPGTDFTPSAKETTKGIDENATATFKSPMAIPFMRALTIKETRDHSKIGEIFQLVELKDGEPALLAKALELYPQLKLSHGLRTHPIIAISYRVLVDILVMLATRTPYTLTTSGRTTLEANLGAATFLGFDKDWIESVRAKVFGIDKSEVLVAEEKISFMEEELDKCDIAFERVQKEEDGSLREVSNSTK